MLINLSISIFFVQRSKSKKERVVLWQKNKRNETSEKGLINIVARIIYGILFHLLCRLWKRLLIITEWRRLVLFKLNYKK